MTMSDGQRVYSDDGWKTAHLVGQDEPRPDEIFEKVPEPKPEPARAAPVKPKRQKPPGNIRTGFTLPESMLKLGQELAQKKGYRNYQAWLRAREVELLSKANPPPTQSVSK